MFNIKKVCVVGAGPAGLCAIRRSIESGMDVIAFEKQDQIGGTWIYTDKTGIDENGVEVHSSMYKNLMTNLPKEIMQFPDFPHSLTGRSFVSSEVILEYLSRFADEFKLRKHIKFSHEVVQIKPTANEKWDVIVRNINESKLEYFTFDGVFVCNGFSSPRFPNIPGRENFLGSQIHSHDYRDPREFENQTVLLIGSGPSGIEMALAIEKYAKKVFWSHHSLKTYGRKINMTVSERVEEKTDVECLSENCVTFVDGTTEVISMIAFATGYRLTYPFISVDCGLSVDDNHIQPLYMHIININNPTMTLINVPFFALGFPLFDLQVRFVLEFWKSPESFPSIDQMKVDTKADEDSRKSQNVVKRKSHLLGPQKHKDYYEQLSEVARIEKLPKVYGKIFDETMRILFDDFNIYRNYQFTIIDDENFRIEYSER